ncbi:MAG: large repetitive protein, partial [Thermoleophilaceae bacterium]|nr:large repetitive protein [Thermoleophilaceae bacterium]
IAGTARDGQTLVGVHGTWSGSLPLSFSHRWQRCDSAGANCANIAGATNSTYLLAPADIGSTIRFVVTASNAGGTLSKASNATAVVAAIPPAVVILPALSGPAEDGGTLTASDGSWTGSPTITLTRQWQRCDAAGANCTNISGATGTTYDEGAADVGDTLRVVVTATNPSGPVSSASPASGVVAATPPVNTAPPTVTGTVIDGQTLAASAGTWTGTATIAYTYQWRRCASTGNSCVDVPGATGSTYLLGPSDVGSTMRVAVTGSNAGGAGVATSVATGSVGAIPPQVTDPPAIAGTSTDGQTLTVSTGDWSGTLGITFTYQWRRCEADGSNCVDIAGETGNTYDLDTADIGSRVRVEVTATNAGGDATVTTQSTSVVQGVPPASTGSGPTVTGIAQQGETLTADPGTWSGTDPITYTYQWRRCDADGQNCVDIPGATGSTYEPTAADVGSTIVVLVTGTNGLGSSSSQSSPIPVVTVGLPANTDRPTVTGELVPGSTLTADPGTWTGPGPITYDYQWQRCDVDGHNCVDIVGATDSTYQVSNTDAGHAIRVEVTAKNPGGSTPQTSEDTDPVPSAEEDLGDSIPGSLVSASRCQRVLAGTGFKQQRMSGVGKIRVKVAAGAYIAPKKPLRIVATAPAAKVRSVMYLLDNRPVLRPRRAPYLLKIKPKLFGKPGMHKVAFKVTPRKGRPHRMTLKITTAPCENVLSGSQWKTSGGTGLKLRVDSRKALQSARFKIPKNMLPSRKDAGKRTIGIAQIYLARGVRKRFELRLRKGDVSATLLKAAVGAPKIVLTKTGAVVTGLPAKAGVVELTLFTRDKTSPKALLAKRRKAKIGATVRVAGKSVRLKTIIKAQRH